MADVFILDCLRSEEREQVAAEVSQMSELDFETSFVAREETGQAQSRLYLDTTFR